MTAHDDFDRALVGWFEADAVAPAPAGRLDRVLDATRRRRPRPAWLSGPGSDWVGDAPAVADGPDTRMLRRTGVRWSMALLVLLAIAALVGGAILVGARMVQPSPLPTARLGQLAYGLDGDIFVARWDGSDPVRIADGAAGPFGSGPGECGSYWGEGAIWAPDGRHLAYRSAWDDSCRTTPGAAKVYISDAKGNVVASFPGTGWLVSWSPDSTRVATSLDQGHTFAIYGLDGVRQALFAVPPGYEVHGDYSPSWSADGMSLLMPIATITPSEPSEIWTFPIDGGPPRPEDPPSHRDWAYSHDGTRAAFIAQDSESLVIARADGTEVRILAGAAISPTGVGQGPSYANPVMSPSGDRVAFVWSPIAYEGVDPSAAHALFRTELRVVDVARGTVTTLAGASDPASAVPIRFSSDGDRLLFSKTDANDASSLWSVNADGSDPRLVVAGASWGDLQWLPSGP